MAGCLQCFIAICIQCRQEYPALIHAGQVLQAQWFAMGATFFNQIIVIYPELLPEESSREQAFRHHQGALGHPANQGGISLGFRDAGLHKGGNFGNA